MKFHHMFTMLLLLCPGCGGIPSGVEPVNNFEIGRYAGIWYEIARLDHPFERDLENVSATYRPQENGSIEVINRGFDRREKRWKTVRGKAKFVGDRRTGRLKVSFFGPFYGGYNIIALDREDYAWALVCGSNRDYFWILARTPRLSPEVLQRLIGQARALDFATDGLIFPAQGRSPGCMNGQAHAL